jgi:hypothetical protein
VGQARGEGVQIPIYGNEKLTVAITAVMIAITAALTELPIRVIVKGKTALGAADVPLWDSDHTKSGWMNVAAMVRWLHTLRELPQYADQSRPVHLILDTFSAHRCQEVRDVARSLNIVMHFIPAGATHSMEPLDRYVFGAMKASCRGIDRSRVGEEGLMKLRKRDSILHLLASWEAMNRTASLGRGRCMRLNERGVPVLLTCVHSLFRHAMRHHATSWIGGWLGACPHAPNLVEDGRSAAAARGVGKH